MSMNASVKRRVVVGCALACSLLQPLAWGSEKQLRIGSLVPKNSVYHRQLQCDAGLPAGRLVALYSKLLPAKHHLQPDCTMTATPRA